MNNKRKKTKVVAAPFLGQSISWGYFIDERSRATRYYVEIEGTSNGIICVPVSKDTFDAIEVVRARGEKPRIQFFVTGEK